MTKQTIRAIRSEADYDRALEAVGQYFDTEPKPGTPEAEEFDNLARLIDEYEDRHWPIAQPEEAKSLSAIDPIELRQDWRAALEKLKQEPLGIRFEPADDYLVIAPSGQTTDREAARDSNTRQLHEVIKRRADDLAVGTARLGNQPGWRALPRAAEAFRDLINVDTEQVADQIGVVWAEVASLASFIEQSDDISIRQSGLFEPLESDVRRSLMDLIQVAGPWTRRFPTARQFDDAHASFQTTRDRVPPAREIAAGVKESEILEHGGVEFVDTILGAGEREGHQSEKARSVGILSVRNIIMGGASVLAMGLIEGFIEHIGGEVAKHSVLAQKIERFTLDKEAALLRFLSDLPSDVRVVVRNLVERLKNSRSDQGVALPPRAELAPNDRRKFGPLEMWKSKPLTERDLTIPVGSNTHATGSINLDKGLLPKHVDHRHYFRNQVFSRLTWRKTKRSTVEEAFASFRLVIGDADHSEFYLRIGHTTDTKSRAYQQRNAMTRLSWGPMRRFIARRDLIGRTLTLYRDREDDTRFILKID